MRSLNLLQFILFIGCAVVAVAALYAAGVAFGLALAGATVLATLALLGWIFLSNLFGRGPDRSP